MRSIFLQHSVNQIKDVAGQINSLNQMVLDFCINAVYSEAQGYIKYLHDVSTLAVPMSNPIMPSQCDKKTHKMPDWF